MSKTNSSSQTAPMLIGVGIVILSLVVLANALSLSLDRGDSAPRGSSLRAAPKGSKVLLKSLASIPDLNVRRNYTEFSQQDLPTDAVMFIIGVTAKTEIMEYFNRGYFHDLSKREFDALSAFVSNGGRLVISMNDTVVNSKNNGSFESSEFISTKTLPPVGTPAPGTPTQPPPTLGLPPNVGPKQGPAKQPTKKGPPPAIPTGGTPTPPQGPATPPKKTTPTPPPTPAGPLLGMQNSPFYDDPFIEQWGADYGREGLSMNDDDDRYVPVTAHPVGETTTFKSQQWHSSYYFSNLDDAWTVHYRSRSYPVMVERSFGAGSIVLISDSYLLSNQGLRQNPDGRLIHWLMDGKSQVIFNERHLNVREDTGVSSLIYRYNLQWFGGAFLLLAILYIWRCTTSLVPLRDSAQHHGRGFVQEGMEAREGFTNLLQRNIKDTDLLKLCYTEWLRSEGKTARLDDETMEHIKRVATDEEVLHNQKLTAEGYRRICDYINKRRK